jgi:ATP-dependent RNA helicase DeaD
MEFKSLGINADILKALEGLGFKSPTPIQEKSIPTLLEGDRDYIGLAQTGTGKTAAFGIPMLHLTDTSLPSAQSLVLCPTRELCLQITNELENYGKHIKGLRIVPVYGGVDINKQIRDLRSGVHVIVGTPGRMVDHIMRRTINLSTVKKVVLDEADEMLNMGFQEDINKILAKTPSEKRTWLFSATMPEEVERISQQYMTDPLRVTVGSKNSSAKNIEHQYCVVRRPDSYTALRRLIDYYPDMFGILFCRTRMNAKDISRKLGKDGYDADALHGDLSQAQRDAVMQKFRNRQLQILVATDVAARGIDVSDVTHVLHYNIPDDIENYTHRSGRTARAGKSGISIAILGDREARRIGYIERKIGQKFTKIQVPDVTDIGKRQLSNFAKTVSHVEVDSEGIKPYIGAVLDELGEFSKEDLITRFASIEFNRFLQAYKNAKNVDVVFSDARDGHSDRSFRQDRLVINIGTVDRIGKVELLDLISQSASIDKDDIKKMHQKDINTVFAIDDIKKAQKIIAALNGSVYNKRKIKVDFYGDHKPPMGGNKKRPMSRRRSGFDSRGGSSERRGGFGSSRRGGSAHGGGFRRNRRSSDY